MTFKIINNSYHIYFATAKIQGGAHLFAIKEFAAVVINSLSFLSKQDRIKLFAFVIMPNHIHFLFKPLKEQTAKTVCFDFVKFTAHKIVRILKEKNYQNLLSFFKNQAKNFNDRNYKIWHDIQAKNCYSEEFVRQKLEYIHNNPINKGWNLVKDRKDYLYSPACYYDSNLKIKPLLPVDYLWNYFF